MQHIVKRRFLDRAESELAARPGAESVGTVSAGPLFRRRGRPRAVPGGGTAAGPALRIRM